ncbi:DUF222 domain-containing protein [Glutamicibacter arilaitensis]|uniref:HNH endonuclease signature motif containing protein n=1 Tax=Glutamicibacter arilaitensis TaxID=256701 RepID=UPI00384D2A74
MTTRIEQLVTALRTTLAGSEEISTSELIALSALAPELQSTLRVKTTGLADPRAALALAAGTEVLAHETVRNQIHCAHLLEATGAHQLEVTQIDAVRASTWDLASEPVLATTRPSYKNAAELLSAWLNIDIFEARRRVNDAHLMICQFDAQGNRCSAQFAGLAQRFNTVGPDPRESLSAARRLEKFEPTTGEFDSPGTASALDSTGQLLEHTALGILAESEPKTRTKKLNRLIKSAKEQATLEDPQADAGIYRKGEKDGLIIYEVRLIPLDAEDFESLLAQADNPRTLAGAASRQLDGEQNPTQNPDAVPDHPDFVTDEEAASATWNPLTEASVARRRLQALMTLLKVNGKKVSRLLAQRNQNPAATQPTESDEPEIPVVRPTVMVHLTLKELTGLATTYGVTEHGFALRPAQLRQVLARAKIIPLVLGGRGEILDIGREQRNFPRYMRRAIKARDRGCIVPGCTVPPEHCELHHIWWWSRGGPTAVYLGCCLCTAHHHDVHAQTLKVISHGGLPQVILPKFVDPAQVPRRNSINDRPEV